MNTDTEALAAYFEAWRAGWPVPGGWSLPLTAQDHTAWVRRVGDGCSELCDCTVSMRCPTELDIQALTGVLVVELARRGYSLHHCERDREHEWWVMGVPGMSGDPVVGPTPLCALVAAWLEVNK